MHTAAGIILAGGKSIRMGTNKALLPLGRKTLLETVIAIIKPLFAQIIIVSNSPDVYRGFNMPLVQDIIPEQGPLGGIHAGLTASPYRYNFVVSCDMPFLNPDLIELFLNSAPGYEVIVPRQGEYLQPLHAVYSRSCLPAIESNLRQGKNKVIDFYPRVKVRYIDVAKLKGYGGLERIFFNINTPTNFIEARRLILAPGEDAPVPTLEQAREILQEGLQPSGTEKINIETAAGRILAVSIAAGQPFPPFDRSQVDGYALGLPMSDSQSSEAGTTDCRYRLLGTVAAGSNREINLKTGTAAAIFTGARIPGGTATVIPQEMVTLYGQHFVSIPFLPPAEKYIEKAGTQIAAGEQVLTAGSLLDPVSIGLLAALGYRQVAVYSRPQIALAANGSELCDPGGNPPLGSSIYNSNYYTLASAIEADGGEVVPLGILEDDLERQAAIYRAALEKSDLVITSGGTGGGAYDLTAAAFTRAGGEIVLTRIGIRPGRQVIVARSGKKLMLGLPGKPAAALAAYYLLLGPLVRVLAGREAADKIISARLKTAIDRPRAERFFAWSRTELGGNGWQVAPLPRKPGGIRAAAGANSLIDLPPGAVPSVGDKVRVILLNTFCFSPFTFR